MIAEGRTARLLLKPMALEDAEQIQALFPRWEIVKYLNAKVPWPYPPDGAVQYIRDAALPGMERGEEWHWTLRLLDRPETIIGCLGLMKSTEENRGFWLAPEYRGGGLMTEACWWANDFYFDVLGFGAHARAQGCGQPGLAADLRTHGDAFAAGGGA